MDLDPLPDLSDCLQSTDYTSDIEKWRNHSLVWHNQSYYYYDFVCQKIRYDRTKEQCESMEARLVLPLGAFGFFGALMSFLVFSRRQFVATDVYLYRAVALVEGVHMLVMTLMHTTSFFDCHSTYVCTFFSAHIYMTATNMCAEMVEFIVVFLCIERTVACLFPQHFHRIHCIRAYRTATLLALITSLPLNLIHSFDISIDEEETAGDSNSTSTNIVKYAESETWFASSQFYARMIDAQLVRFCLVAPVIVVATAGSIVGLRQAVGRKRRLRGELLKSTSTRRTSMKNLFQRQLSQPVLAVNSKNGKVLRPMASQATLMTQQSTSSMAAADRTRKEIKQMIDLCCLQLCLAVPIVINYLLCMAERAAKWNIVIPDRARLYEEAFEMPYDSACAMIKRATVLEYLRFAISLTHMMAHGLHFYLYISFSAKFRQTLLEWVCGGKERRLGVCGVAVRKRWARLSRRTATSAATQEDGDGSASRTNGTVASTNNDYASMPAANASCMITAASLAAMGKATHV